MTFSLRTAIAASAAAIMLAACSTYDNDSNATAAAASAVSVSIDLPAAGQFDGRSDHIVVGGVTLTATDGGYVLAFDDSFSLDGAPDPVVGFGRNGAYVKASAIGDLKQQTGAQSYELPADFDATTYNEVYVWCDQFSVPLGVATLQ